MRVLVTGATGLVGSCLARRLVDAGASVRVLARPSSQGTLLGDAAGGVEWIDGDLTDPSSVADAVRGVSRIFHCAARVGFQGRTGYDAMWRVNVEGTRHVVEAALAHGVERLVHTSSVAALGRPESAETIVDEGATWSPSRSNTSHGRTKYLSELEVQRGIAEGLDAVIVNPGLVFGPGRRGENTWRLVEAVRSGTVRGYPTGGIHPVDVEDVATGHLLAMEKGQTGERYILCGEFLPWRDVLSTLARAFGRRAPSVRLPAGLLYTVATIFEAVAWTTGRASALTRDSARASSRTTRFDAGRARRDLGWAARPFAETAARLAHLAATVMLFVSVAACRKGVPPSDPAQPGVAVTFHALATIVGPVIGDRGTVITLLEPGTSPHVYEPRASDVRRVSASLATVHIARELDGWVLDLGAPRPVALFELVPEALRRGPRGAPDPHVWLSPHAVAGALPGLARHLCAADPPACRDYRIRAEALADSLAALDRRLASLLRDAPPLVFSGPFLTYWADRYGLRILGVVERVEGVEPSPGDLRAAIDAARAAVAVVGQPWLPEGPARAVAEAAGVPYVTVDPIGDPESTPTYASLVLGIARRLTAPMRHE